MSAARRVEVAIVGGGPAGAALAIRLAAAGREVALFERLAAPRWRAAGVYSSPRTRACLADLGLDPADIDRLVRPIRAMAVGTLAGTGCMLEHDPPFACGLDRVRLERALLDRAAATGACVHEGVAVHRVDLDGASSRGVDVSTVDGTQRWAARVVIGADGPRSLVARTAGVDRPMRRFRRAGLTVHHADPDSRDDVPGVARMTIGAGWYCGVAPVPGGRVNVGIVIPGAWLRTAARASPAPDARPVAGAGARTDALVRDLVERLPGPREAWQDAPATDHVAVALPLAHRPTRLAGAGWLLVGDAAGFLDPLSGEGLHRALVSAELAASAIMSGDRPDAYDRRMRARFRGKDALSWLLQAFLARPALAGYALARLDRRPHQRATFNQVLTDLVPASAAFDPRFLARVLAP